MKSDCNGNLRMRPKNAETSQSFFLIKFIIWSDCKFNFKQRFTSFYNVKKLMEIHVFNFETGKLSVVVSL